MHNSGFLALYLQKYTLCMSFSQHHHQLIFSWIYILNPSIYTCVPTPKLSNYYQVLKIQNIKELSLNNPPKNVCALSCTWQKVIYDPLHNWFGHQYFPRDRANFKLTPLPLRTRANLAIFQYPLVIYPQSPCANIFGKTVYMGNWDSV